MSLSYIRCLGVCSKFVKGCQNALCYVSFWCRCLQAHQNVFPPPTHFRMSDLQSGCSILFLSCRLRFSHHEAKCQKLPRSQHALFKMPKPGRHLFSFSPETLDLSGSVHTVRTRPIERERRCVDPQSSCKLSPSMSIVSLSD